MIKQTLAIKPTFVLILLDGTDNITMNQCYDLIHKRFEELIIPYQSLQKYLFIFR